jgi:acetyl/propionyl-CoA carboxylase alpha subunit
MRFVATTADGATHAVEIESGEAGYRVVVDGRVWEVDARRIGPAIDSLLVDGVSYLVSVAGTGGEFVVGVGGEIHEVRVEEAARFTIRTRGGGGGTGGGQTLKAPLPGKITHVAVKPGDAVNRGDTLIVIEAMKMENEFKAAAAGTVREVPVTAGQAVNPGDVLVVIA